MKPGQPLPFGPQRPEFEVAVAGDYDAGDGVKVVIKDQMMMFLAQVDGTSITMGVPVTDILEGIQDAGRKSES